MLPCDNRFLHFDNRVLHCDNRYLHCSVSHCEILQSLYILYTCHIFLDMPFTRASFEHDKFSLTSHLVEKLTCQLFNKSLCQRKTCQMFPHTYTRAKKTCSCELDFNFTFFIKNCKHSFENSTRLTASRDELLLSTDSNSCKQPIKIEDL